MATNHNSPTHAGLPSRSDDPRYNADPPAASGTPLQGQLETNQALPPSADREAAASAVGPAVGPRHPAYEFAWQSYLQFGRSSSTTAPTFESVEPELERRWQEFQKTSAERQPWKEARDIARDAWQQVRDAMSGE